MIKGKFLERYHVPTMIDNGNGSMESERCRLGNDTPLGDCVKNCSDFEPGE